VVWQKFPDAAGRVCRQSFEHVLEVIAPMEALGYTLPEKYEPDISQCKMFCQHARDVLGS
jgi:hypothetical protein